MKKESNLELLILRPRQASVIGWPQKRSCENKLLKGVFSRNAQLHWYNWPKKIVVLRNKVPACFLYFLAPDADLLAK